VPYKAYFESASEASMVVGQFCSIVEVNPRALEIFGYGSEELEGQKVELLLPRRLWDTHEEHRADYFKSTLHTANGKWPQLVGCLKDGQECPIDVGLTFANTDRG
jgi:PAS domain S-box-containing protein